MAAISALMINDDGLRRDAQYEAEHGATTPRAPQFPTDIGHETVHRSSISQAPSPGTAQSPSDEMADDRRRSLARSMDLDKSTDNGQDGSDNDTELGDEGLAARKKKGQRFFCTGYPPCNLSFTRSEHLARHIRKHTGERPFQCHCNRRFSRLDNLRQHAQTVHVNEEIPTDSLAATGTRFQRQIRTDRVRPTHRPRTSTLSSTGSHSRGHSRNLSASSIGSTTSSYSTSTIDPRRRPPTFLPDDGRPKLGLNPPSTPPPQYVQYATNSPADATTPTSATFSIAPESPGYRSTLGSPLPPVSRPGGFFGGTPSSARRLSVPSGPPPFQVGLASLYSPAYANGPGPAVPTNSSAVPSPTASHFSHTSSSQGSASEDWRRRTWHPSSYPHSNLPYNRPATSGLTYSQTPDAPRPAYASNATAAAGQAPRLPGIESFDHVQKRPTTPPRRGFGHSHSQSQPILMPPLDFDSSRRDFAALHPARNPPNSAHDDSARHDPHERTWAQETLEQIQMLHDNASKRPTEAFRPAMGPPQPQVVPESSPESANKRQKRNEPSPGMRTSPEDSGSSDGIHTPRTSASDLQPAILHSNGTIEPHHATITMDTGATPCFPAPPSFPAHMTAPSHPDRSVPPRQHIEHNANLNRLEALVAIATGENNSGAHDVKRG